MPKDPKQHSKRRTTSRKKDPTEGLPPLNVNAAGIDVGSAEHHVAVPPDRDAEPVQSFGSFTADLHRMARWLKDCRIQTVVMQATGVYWTSLYDVLQSHGLEVNVAHAQHTKTLPGRKTDVQECQWLQKLHTFGLLNNAFRPAEEIRVLRSYLRQRENLVAAAATCVQHMQKALTEMNIQLANVISDISGTTGMAIVRDIVKGEHDPEKLARHKHARIHASRQEIARSLEGTWRQELLFVLEQSLDLYDTYQEKIRSCDGRIDEHLRSMGGRIDPLSEPIPEPTRRGKGARPRQPSFDLRGHLYRITGVDLTQIDSIDVQVAQTVISEVGVDMSRWKTEKHFASWLGLCPDNRISGGKVLKHGTRRVVNRAATALRLAAWSLIRSQSALGAKFRRLRSKLGAPKAITAMAHTLARLIYRMLKFGRQYVDQGIEYYENKYRQQQLKWVAKQAATLRMQLVPLSQVAS
jgi:transposase